MSKDVSEADALKLFTSIGLDETVAKNANKNPKGRATLVEVIAEAGFTNTGCGKAFGNLLYTVSTKFPANALVHRPTLIKYILDETIKTVAQLDGACDYYKKVTLGQMKVTPEEIKAAVAEAVKASEEKLKTERYHCNTNIILGGITRSLKWAEGATVRAELEAQVAVLLGPKTEEDLKPPPEKKKVKAPKPAKDDASKAKAGEPAPEPAVAEDPYAFFPKPEDNNVVHTTVNFSDGRVMRIANSKEKLEEHLAITGGKVWTRFPPEPNGYLHIGHAKAMFVDFGMSEQYDGNCYLRFDDTNPDAEKQEYIDHIKEIVAWMGWKPWKITYSSDYFKELYAFAIQLIKSGHAYVCHQTKEEIEECREKKMPSPYRDRPMEESLALFEDMRRGLVDEGKATLRMRQDHKNENYNMFDLIAYRIKFVEHPHGGDTWCVYPSYDYTHCIVDALENISHSLCTLEFESRRASYYWLLEVLDIYKPLVWEYARLNITNNVMSKRKLNKLVMASHVNGWDDPRLLSLAGLRRRGVTPGSINTFCKEIGITRNENLIHMHKLEHHIRLDLDASSPRTLAVLRPLKVTITNLPESHFEEFDAKVSPGRSDATYKVPFTRVVYIEATDFKEADEKGYYGFAPNKQCMLRYAYVLTCTGFKKDGSGKVVELTADADLNPGDKKPPKGVLNWVAQPKPGVEPLKLECRLYDFLFNSEDPQSLGDDWLGDINPDSLEIVKGAYGNPALADVKVFDRFQFERLGYFAVDPDSSKDCLVFNRTVTLKESSSSKQVAPAAGAKK
eukprot:gene30329-35322_t